MKTAKASPAKPRQKRVKTLREEAVTLAKSHRRGDRHTKIIKLVPDPKGEEIRLVEVSEKANDLDEVLSMSFAPSPQFGIGHKVTVILLSKGDWGKVEAGTLSLPTGWELNAAEDL
jgi:hypothetical protein